MQVALARNLLHKRPRKRGAIRFPRMILDVNHTTGVRFNGIVYCPESGRCFQVDKENALETQNSLGIKNGVLSRGWRASHTVN